MRPVADRTISAPKGRTTYGEQREIDAGYGNAECPPLRSAPTNVPRETHQLPSAHATNPRSGSSWRRSMSVNAPRDLAAPTRQIAIDQGRHRAACASTTTDSFGAAPPST